MTETTLKPLSSQLNGLYPLDTELRSEAVERAKAYVKEYSIGAFPTAESVANNIVRKFDPKIVKVGIGLIILLLIAAFPVSSSRLFHIGYHSFMEQIPHDASARVAGWATVLSAEFGLITFALVWGVLKDGGRRWYILGLLASVGITFLGNVVVMKPYEQSSAIVPIWAFAWAWFETMAFPIISIATGIAIKNIVILRNNEQYEKDVLLQTAKNKWNEQVKHIEKHADYNARLRSSLKDAIYTYNNKNRGKAERQAVMRQLQRRHWAYLVQREMDELSWDDPKAPAMLTALLAQDGIIGSQQAIPINPTPSPTIQGLSPIDQGKRYTNGIGKAESAVHE